MRPGRKDPPVKRPARQPAAFTLIETMLALVIIGVGVVAVIQAQREFISNNLWSTHASTATYLANEIRELTRNFPRHDKKTGGIFFTNPADASTFTGWGPETGENTVNDLNDLDDFDGAVFGSATTFPAGFTMTKRYAGPINAFGDVIPETKYDGTTETPTAGNVSSDVPMRGWTQIVQVTKVDPYDYSTPVDKKTQKVNGTTIQRAVDRYPVRVTVTVLYQGVWDEASPAVTSTSWIIAPP